ncbi:hypothetical protein EDC04DRAFT_2637787 [Pisolithus marmoratus]|nr:hypothetical protein EDC04DRAFT_2637787 [Pisolithus marmoratus]
MSVQDFEQRRGAEPERTFIQFARRWVLGVRHLFHPFLRPVHLTIVISQSTFIFCSSYAHIVSRRPFHSFAAFRLVARPTNLLQCLSHLFYIILQFIKVGRLARREVASFTFFTRPHPIVPPNRPFSSYVGYFLHPCSTSQLVIVAANLASSNRNRTVLYNTTCNPLHSNCDPKERRGRSRPETS